jgi:hypothetical protein
MHIWERILAGLGTIFLFWPDNPVKGLGFVLLAGIYVFQRIGLKRQEQMIPTHVKKDIS